MDLFLFIMDKESVAGRPLWAWLEYQSEEINRPQPVYEDTNDDKDAHTESTYILPPGLTYQQALQPCYGIPTVYYFSDYHQLPPVAIKGIHNSTAAKNIDFYDYIVLFAFQIFIQRQPDSGTDLLIVIMDEVITQDYQELLKIESKQQLQSY